MFIENELEEVDMQMTSDFTPPKGPPPPPTTKKCPFCAETIPLEAIRCKHCGEFLDARFRPRPPQQKGKWIHSTGAIVLALLAIGPLALPMVWTHPRWNWIVKGAISAAVIVGTLGLCVGALLMYNSFLTQIETMGF